MQVKVTPEQFHDLQILSQRIEIFNDPADVNEALGILKDAHKRNGGDFSPTLAIMGVAIEVVVIHA